jgi:hypothetical protein
MSPRRGTTGVVRVPLVADQFGADSLGVWATEAKSASLVNFSWLFDNTV